MSRSPAIVRKFPGKPVGHIKLWWPAKDKPGEYTTRAEVECWVTDAVADLILTLAALGQRLPPETEGRVVELMEEIRALPGAPSSLGRNDI